MVHGVYQPIYVDYLFMSLEIDGLHYHGVEGPGLDVEDFLEVIFPM